MLGPVGYRRQNKNKAMATTQSITSFLPLQRTRRCRREGLAVTRLSGHDCRQCSGDQYTFMRVHDHIVNSDAVLADVARSWAPVTLFTCPAAGCVERPYEVSSHGILHNR
jgi:hypothetical protein